MSGCRVLPPPIARRETGVLPDALRWGRVGGRAEFSDLGRRGGRPEKNGPLPRPPPQGLRDAQKSISPRISGDCPPPSPRSGEGVAEGDGWGMESRVAAKTRSL